MSPGKGTPIRPVRIDDELWKAALEAANAAGESVSVVIRRALEDYVATQRSSE